MDAFDNCDIIRINDMIEYFFADIEAESLEWFGKSKQAEVVKMRNAIIEGMYKKALDKPKQK